MKPRTHILQAGLLMLYFAYGSNMNWPQMHARCPDAKFHCVASLRDHRLAFTRTSPRWQNGGVGDVVADSGRVVWGVVYEVSPGDIAKLDSIEGFQPGHAANEYTREKVTVYDRGRTRKPLEVEIYRAVSQGKTFAPSAGYMKTIVDGAKHWKLPELYIEELEKIPTAK